jgi:hypothetical protein
VCIAGALLVCAGLLAIEVTAAECHPPRVVEEAGAAAIQEFVAGERKSVLTFVGYSGAEYEDPAAMSRHARRVLNRFDPAATLVNIGATRQGIGAVYPLAKELGFTTLGIVSALARQEGIELSPCVDYVFYVPDSTWGGLLPGSTSLSPTSSALVSTSNTVVGIGGGPVARDELLAARAAGKQVEFVPADMNHRLAREKAKKKGAPDPTDFSGAAAAALDRGI